MTGESGSAGVQNTFWLLVGVAFGAIITAALSLLIVDFVRGDAPRSAGGTPLFVEEAGSAGVEHTYGGEFQFFVGGGAAVFDCNGDRFPDLYLAGGANPASLYVNQSSVAGHLEFDRQFSDSTDLVDVTGAYPLDVDSDGLEDLVVLRVGENMILRGLGDCEFAPANDDLGINGGDDWTVAFSAKWESGEEMPTMVYGNYLASAEPGERDACATHDLLTPTQEGYRRVELAPGWCTLSALFSDWSATGQQDLRLTNDRHYYRTGQEQLWQVAAGEAPALYTSNDGWANMQIWGMGIASHDVTGDGLPEVFLTSQGDNKLQTLADGPEQPTYVDIALGAGVNAHRPFVGDTDRPSTAWHAEFADLNNDAFIDLFVTKGNVDDIAEFAMDDPNNLLLGQPNGKFTEAAIDAGLLDYARSRGAALADLNLDGMLDVVVIERREPAKIWRNTGTDGDRPGGNWLAVDIEQDAPNRNAIGAWVEVRLGNTTLRKELTVGGGHAGGQVGWIHFGLGAASAAELRVLWPDGEVGPWMTAPVNQFAIIDRGSSGVTPWVPVRN
ncbi:MAG TPA: CRTAC1 family protein [Acidimicrobiia bacterium]